MERGELLVTTEDPEGLKRIKISVLIGSIALAVLLIWSSLTAANATPQMIIFSVVIGVVLMVIGVVNFVRPESCCSAYENGVAGLAVRGSGSKTDPFELPYEQITELRRFKKRGMEKNLLICTAQAEYNVYCRIHQQALISAILDRITQPAESAEEDASV